jgi:multidrug resistance efflux pump
VGDAVEAGVTVLARLDTAELRLQLAEAKAEKAGFLKQSATAMRDGKTAVSQIADAEADKVQARIDLLQYKIDKANVVSGTSGTVVKGDLKRQIGAPVNTGDVLFEINPLDSLRATVFVPEDEASEIRAGQSGELATVSYPGRKIRFTVEHVNPIAEIVNQRNVFKVRVQLEKAHPWLRPGMEGIAKISVGERNYVWMWTRKVVNWVKMKFWL